MSVLLTEALKELALKPGESRSVAIDDYEVEIRRPIINVADEGPMVNIVLDVPPSPRSVTILAEKRSPILPSRIEITESDLAPE
jgi:hypothetical protein